MAQFNALINNPTEEQADSLREWLEDKASDEYDPPHYPIVIFDLPNYVRVQGNYMIHFFNEDEDQSNTIDFEMDTDTEE